MFPYTHYALAYKLAKQIEPDRLDEYLWGAIAPDVRYLVGMRRQQTHLPRKEMLDWFKMHPQLQSFILGYQVHCLLDEIDLVLVLERAFPLNLIRLARRRPFTQQQMGALVELSYIQAPAAYAAFAGTHNPILDGLGVRPEHSEAYAAALGSYLAEPSMESGLSAFTSTGLIADARIERYMDAAQSLGRSRLVRAFFLPAVRQARFEQKALGYVGRHIQPNGRDRRGDHPG